MAIIDTVTFTNDAGTTYATISEAWVALKEANPDIANVSAAMVQRAADLGLNNKYITTESDTKNTATKTEDDDNDDRWDNHAYESHKRELTADSTGMIVTRTWTDELWADCQSIPHAIVGNGWTRTATFETVSDEILS